MSERTDWPELRFEDWKETCQTLHLWVQIVGKIRLSKSSWIIHSWHSPFYLTERGITTSLIHDKMGAFSIELDFLTHHIRFSRSDGRRVVFPLTSQAVSVFYGKCLAAMKELEIEAKFHGAPNELPEAIPFAQDEVHRIYDAEFSNRFWRVLLPCDRIMKEFRSRFSGKASPVHLFWGSFDLAATRFSGRRAPEHPGGVPHLPNLVAREAYSDEVSSCGFWPGNEQFPMAAFYSYAYPKPDGFEAAQVPDGAYFDTKLREFILPYEVVRASATPNDLITEFFQATYEAAADLGHWDRGSLEGSEYLIQLRAALHG
jgi:hypothetical protein